MADYYLKTDNIMKNMFTVALKDELAAQSRMGTVHPETEAMLQKVRAYELSEKSHSDSAVSRPILFIVGSEYRVMDYVYKT